ncbi:MAG: thioredoxin domain-containing protein, partial [Oligoflexia bacterium]|nr:thioredoxin domain-containing protein [Oligoflexia bacterium]
VMAWYNMQKGGAVADVAKATASGNSSDAYAQLMEQPGGVVTLDGTEPVLGNPAAPYTVLEYADFQCPACAAVTPMLHDLVAKDPNIKVIFKNYPLSSLCNSSMNRVFHENSCRASTAGECARQQDHFWDLAHLMFKNQTELDDDGLNFMASQAGVDASAFAICMADPASLDAVRADANAGNALGIDSTPRLYLHGIAGDDWVMLTAGPEGAELLVRAHAAGKTLPAAPPAGSHPRH